ncbi:MAG TPA: DUF885 domain-containing protein [Parafilimonas sp.]|nr:DUF885 domain-containing protein [Parafilimonas sp.]
MKKLLYAIAVSGLLASCNNNQQANNSPSANGDDAFKSLSDTFISGYLKWRPATAIYLGIHDYDGQISDLSQPSLDAELDRLKKYDAELASTDTASLSSKMFYDFRILRNAVKNEIFSFEELNVYARNPILYAYAADISIYIKRDFAPLEQRLQYLISIENQLPGLFAVAKQNLKNTLAKPLVQTAMDVASGFAVFMKGDLLIAVKDVNNDTLMASFKKANASAIAAINDYVQWLKTKRLPQADNNYAIGKENYQKMLLYNEDMSISSGEILAIGLKELKKEQDEFNAAAKIINPNKKPIDVFHDVQKEHSTADSLISDAKRHLENIRQFVIDKKIMTIPSDVRVQVKETPEFARSTSTASMDMPGPFEKKATESYYYITPVDPKWNAKQKEDWLSMFDYYTTDNVSIHEAYPGHYVQGLHLNASDATDIEKIFGSYAFIEGWAHYCEKMMIEEGWSNNGDSITAAKYHLAQSGDALLRICRLCVSIKMHCQGMTLDEGTKFFMDNWYQGEKPSYQEALRGTFDPGYLFYTVGKLEILKLREDYKQQEGSNYSLMKFNDAINDNGMPPVRLLRERLLKDTSKWAEVL